jgi:hypothetical protein
MLVSQHRLTFDMTFPACFTTDICSVLRHTRAEPHSRFLRGIDEPPASLTHLIYPVTILEGDLSTAAGGVRFDNIARFETGKWLPFCSNSMRQGLLPYPATCPELAPDFPVAADAKVWMWKWGDAGKRGQTPMDARERVLLWEVFTRCSQNGKTARTAQ